MEFLGNGMQGRESAGTTGHQHHRQTQSCGIETCNRSNSTLAKEVQEGCFWFDIRDGNDTRNFGFDLYSILNT